MKFKVGQVFRKGGHINKITSIELIHRTYKHNPRFAWDDLTNSKTTSLDKVDIEKVELFNTKHKDKKISKSQYVKIKFIGGYFNILPGLHKESQKKYIVKDDVIDLLEVGDMIRYDEDRPGGKPNDIHIFKEHNGLDKYIVEIWTPNLNDWNRQWPFSA